MDVVCKFTWNAVAGGNDSAAVSRCCGGVNSGSDPSPVARRLAVALVALAGRAAAAAPAVFAESVRPVGLLPACRLQLPRARVSARLTAVSPNTVA